MKYDLEIRRKKKGIVQLIIPCLLPLIIINLILGNQSWTENLVIGPFLFTQITNWIILVLMAYIIIHLYGSKLWVLLIIFLPLITKIVSVALGQPDSIEWMYQIFTWLLYLSIGSAYIRNYLTLIYKQVMVFCLLNLILMILQTSNAGEWTMFLSHENLITSYPSIFVSVDNLNFSMSQARPTGLFYSNNILSGVLLFSLALHFSKNTNRYWWGSIILSAMIVYTSARIVYLGYIILGMFIIFFGGHINRKKYISNILLTIFFLWLYSIIYPGYFTLFWTTQSLLISVFYRLNDIVANLDSGNIIRSQLESYLIDTPRLDNSISGEDISGFSAIIRVLPYFIGLLVVLFPIYIKRFKRQRIIAPQLTWVTFSCLLIFMIYPAAVPIFKSQFYWFFAGFAMLPFFINIRIRNFHNPVL